MELAELLQNFSVIFNFLLKEDFKNLAYSSSPILLDHTWDYHPHHVYTNECENIQENQLAELQSVPPQHISGLHRVPEPESIYALDPTLGPHHLAIAPPVSPFPVYPTAAIWLVCS